MGGTRKKRCLQPSWFTLTNVLSFTPSKRAICKKALKTIPGGNKDNIFQYWALNDVGTALFILGEAYRNAGQYEEAAQAYKKLINEYFYAQCWDPKGWFWKPAEAAEKNY